MTRKRKAVSEPSISCDYSMAAQFNRRRESEPCDPQKCQCVVPRDEPRNCEERPPREKSSSSYNGKVGLYEIRNPIGYGNFSIVCEAYCKEMKSKVAVKIIGKRYLTNYGFSRVKREIDVLRSLEHPYIIQIHQVAEDNHNIYIFTEYAEKGELYDYLAYNSRLPEDKARYKFWQIVSAIEYMHSRGIVHRDLKAENLLLDENENIKIADFGFSNFYVNNHKMRTFCGSAPYAAPEIFEAKPYNGPSIDIWSLGVILYVMTTATMPFESSTSQGLHQSVVNAKFRVPYYMSWELEDLIKRMLTKDPLERATIQEVKAHPWMAKNNIERRIEMEIDTYNCLLRGGASEESAARFLEKNGVEPEKIAIALAYKSLDQTYGLISLLKEKYRKKYAESTLRGVEEWHRSEKEKKIPRMAALRNAQHFQTMDSGVGSSIFCFSRQSTSNNDSVDEDFEYDSSASPAVMNINQPPEEGFEYKRVFPPGFYVNLSGASCYQRGAAHKLEPGGTKRPSTETVDKQMQSMSIHSTRMEKRIRI